VERLEALRREYNETIMKLAHPLSLADLQQLRERRQAILGEARVLAESLKLTGPQWFSIGSSK